MKRQSLTKTVSATSIRLDHEGPPADAGLPLAEGNRVLASIGRQEGLSALLAFSGLHEQIRRHHLTAGSLPDRDLFQTERFFFDEVLHLICDRALALIHADAVIIAMREGSDFACHAAAGSLPLHRDIRLNRESEFLRECLVSGGTVRCDDAQTDRRLDSDLSQTIGARATVLVPLRGYRQQVGVLQAFSVSAWSFTNEDVRCLELFAELILAALRPEDQDRRFHWLADVADDILQATPAPEPALETAVEPAIKTAVEPAELVAEFQQPEIDWRELEKVDAVDEEDTSVEFSTDFANQARRRPALRVPEFGPHSLGAEANGNILTAHPGLSVVMGLVAVAALFSAGVWWGMQQHGRFNLRTTAEMSGTQIPEPKAATQRVTSKVVPASMPTAAPSASNASNVSDNLMDAAEGASQAALSPVPASKLAALPKITGVRTWSSSMGSTVVIDMQDQVPYEVHRLMSPERIYFDLHDTALVPELEGKTMDVGDASLSRVRVAQPVAGVTRVVLDTRGGSNFSVSLETDPYRLVVELRDLPKSLSASKVVPASAAKLAATSLAAGVEPTPIKTGKFRIVLDPGHGGWDLGTVGRQGLVEKDLVLDVTRRLGKLLHDRLGSDVMFTRTGDDYLPLDQRADFANRVQADLFVSVHANYSTSATARGVETYYTNLFSAPGSKEVEKQADGTFTQPTPVSLSTGALHEKIEESRRLAADVQRSLYSTLATKSPDIRDRGIKDAAFVVLTGTTMPSILTEISFVSSPTDEHNLQSEAYRQQIAEALYKGIARYQESSPRARVAQLQPVAARRQ
ncbi:MAG: N-acetylmuramoyl-L-alanine amidase [Terriglobales bacterium]